MNKQQAMTVMSLAESLADARISKDAQRTHTARMTLAEKLQRIVKADAGDTVAPVEWFALKASQDGTAASMIHIGQHADMASAQAAAERLPGVSVVVIDAADALAWRNVFDSVLMGRG